MSLRVYGHEQLMADLAKVEGTIDTAIVKGLDDVAEKIKDDAKTICPVDTGSLQKSIRRQKHATPEGHVHSVSVSAGGYITNPKTGRKVDYAAHVELGTSKTPPKPFMQPALEKNREEIRRILTKKLLEALP